MNVYLDLLARADWISILVALIGIVVGFFGTTVSAGLAVAIALWLQRRDFKARATELAGQMESSARQERSDWRRVITSRAFAVLDEAATYGQDPYELGVQGTKTLNKIDSLQMEFRLDSEPGGNHVGEWFKRRALMVMAPHNNPLARAEHVKGLSATMRFDLSEWAAGRKASDSFARI